MVTVARASFQSQQTTANKDGDEVGGKSTTDNNNGKKNKNKNSAAGGGVTAAQLKTAYAATKQALSWAEDDDSGVMGALALKIVVVEGFFEPASFALGPSYEQRLEAKIAGECEVFGDIEKITVYSKHPAGVTLVKYATAFAAQQCVLSLNGRTFAIETLTSKDKQRALKAYYWDGSTNYDIVGTGKRARDIEQEEEEAEREERQRLDEFGAWIEDQELPEEFGLRSE